MSEAKAGPSVTVILMGVTGSECRASWVRSPSGWTAGDGRRRRVHSAANVVRCEAGRRSPDEDRWPWPPSIAEWIGAREREAVDAGVSLLGGVFWVTRASGLALDSRADYDLRLIITGMYA
jgi:hypothetical protein